MTAINNLTPEFGKIDEKFLLNAAKKILKKEKISPKINLSIAFVAPEEIKRLNQRYRKKNKATDVLSFGKLPKNSFQQEEFFEPEIIICLEEVQKNAEYAKEPFKKELIRVLIHAFLHLLGWDHEKSESAAKKMFQKQEEYLSLFRFNTKK